MLNKISCGIFCPTSSASKVCVQSCVDNVKCLPSFVDIISVTEANNSYLNHESLKKKKKRWYLGKSWLNYSSPVWTERERRGKKIVYVIKNCLKILHIWMSKSRTSSLVNKICILAIWFEHLKSRGLCLN